MLPVTIQLLVWLERRLTHCRHWVAADESLESQIVLPVLERVVEVVAVADVVESAHGAELAIVAGLTSVAVVAAPAVSFAVPVPVPEAVVGGAAVGAVATPEEKWVAPEHREDSERTTKPLETPLRSLIVVVLQLHDSVAVAVAAPVDWAGPLAGKGFPRHDG